MRKKTMLPAILLVCISALQLQAQQALKGGSADAKLTPGLSGDGNQGSVYSPDLFNGTANINVPIYSYGASSISLSYNTAGIKVDELPGSVGLHWCLNAGGSITRVVKDVPDEINTYNSTAYPMGSGDVGDYVLGVKGKWAQYFGGVNPSGTINDESRYMDDESDDFIFSVGGLSFTFNIGKDGFIFTNPHTNIKIDILINGNPVTQMPLSSNNSSLNFRVRDARGNWYYFVIGDVSKKSYETLNLQYTSRWVISKIVQNDGNEIRFQYNNLNLENLNSATNLYIPFSGIEQNGLAATTQGDFVSAQSVYQSTSYIASISYPNSTLATFVYDPNSGSRCDDPGNAMTNPILREIQISSGYAGTRYIMEQKYSLASFNSSTPSETTFGSPCYDISSTITDDYRYQRLILKGIHISDMDGNITEPYYSFNYNTDVRLPARFSGAQDYYGYYNGITVTQNQGMLNIPYHVPKLGSGSAYGVDRNDHAAYISAGLLTSLTNASGGKTEFEYEPHQLSNVLSDADITLPTDNYFYGAQANDGIRVHSVKTSDSRYPGAYQKQIYTYSGGQRFMPGGYFDYPLWNGGTSILFNSGFVSPHQFINGSNHGYSTVTVESKNDLNQSLSKRIMTFQNISRGYHNTSYYSPGGSKKYFELPFTDKQYIKEWEIGLPLTITNYDQNGKVISITANTYSSTIDNTSTTGKVENLKILATNDISGANTTTLVTESYKPYTGISLLTQTIVQQYINDAAAVTDEIDYSYDDRNNLETTTTKNSRGEDFMLKNIYNYDVSGTNVQYGGQAGTLHDMTDAGLEFKVGMERWKTSLSNYPYSNRLFDANITCFQYQNNKISTKKIFTLRSKEPISYSEYTGLVIGGPFANQYSKILAAYNSSQPGGYFQQMSEVLQYDTKGNPLETKISDQESYKSMIWDPGTGEKLADVSNARLKDIGFTSFERSVGLSYTGSENSTDGRFSYNQWGSVDAVDAISGTRVYKLIPSGSTANNKITSPLLTAGVTYVMTFWAKNFAPNISGAGLVNIEYNNIHYLNDWVQFTAKFTPTINGSIQFTTTQTLYIDEIRLFPIGSQMTNQIYAPMAGLTSSTDAQGRITYYLHDALGRQTAQKDQDGNVISKQERHIAQ